MTEEIALRYFLGFLGGFLATYIVYYLLSFFVFKKMEKVKGFRFSLGITAILLLSVTEHNLLDSLLFYIPPLVNIYFIENYRLTMMVCPRCEKRIKKDSAVCKYCNKKIVTV